MRRLTFIVSLTWPFLQSGAFSVTLLGGVARIGLRTRMRNEDDHLANIRAGDESQIESSKKESITDQMKLSNQTCLEKVKALFGGTISSILNMSTTGCNATLATSDNILSRVQ